MKLQLWKLVLSVLLCITIGAIGGFFFTSGEIDTWYAALEKPPLNPPDWIFAPVWTTLYILMGISLALYWSAEYGNPNAPGSWYFDSTGSQSAVVTVVLNCILRFWR